MIDRRGLHARLVDMCDCYAETDCFRELSRMEGSTASEETALKWLALAVLHGIESGAEEIELCRKEGETTATAEYRKARLPAPSPEVLDKAMEIVREVLHFEEEKGESPLILGLRTDSLELRVKAKRKDGEEKVKLKFPRTKE
jgi:hypothetical protein